jgi:predicted MFS family arabinose efflux permease
VHRVGILGALTLGTFCIGTELYMLGGIAPRILADVGAELSLSGVLVGVSALIYAVAAPLFAFLFRRADHRFFLAGAVGTLSIGALIASVSRTFESLMLARIMNGLAAAAFSPAAYAIAASVGGASYRGRALSVVGSGITFAIAVGVPLTAYISNVASWRFAFALVGVLAVIAAVGIVLFIPTGALTDSSESEYEPRILVPERYLLGATFFWAAGGYAIYPFVAPILYERAGVIPEQLPLWLLAFGIASVLGGLGGGWLVDRAGRAKVAIVALLANAIAQMSFSVQLGSNSPGLSTAVALVGLVTWGFSAWAYYPALQSSLVVNGGSNSRARFLLSTSVSVLYLGMTSGALLAAWIVSRSASLGLLGAIGGGSQLVAALLFACGTMKGSRSESGASQT